MHIKPIAASASRREEFTPMNEATKTPVFFMPPQVFRCKRHDGGYDEIVPTSPGGQSGLGPLASVNQTQKEISGIG
jgi:hypothetical protein